MRAHTHTAGSIQNAWKLYVLAVAVNEAKYCSMDQL